MSIAAWQNAVSAMLVDHAFAEDLAASVTNDGSRNGAARWFLTLASDFLRGRGQPDGPIAAFDFAVIDWEALAEVWPVVREAATLHGAEGGVLAPLARFVAERLPAAWSHPPFVRHAPVTRATVIADRVDTLVGMFIAGLKPNGSSDPYALRRAAKHFLHQIVFPITVGRAA